MVGPPRSVRATNEPMPQTTDLIAAVILGSAQLHIFVARLSKRLWMGLRLLFAVALLGTAGPAPAQDKQPVIVYVAPVTLGAGAPLLPRRLEIGPAAQ